MRLGVSRVPVAPGENPAAEGRTMYPRGADPGRPAFVTQRERRPFAERLADVRLAARLPEGRPRHLVQRFPRLTVSGGPDLYAGERRQDLLVETYRAVIGRAPDLVPAPEDLATAAELGEESVIDRMLAEVDRDVRLQIDGSSADFAGAQQIMDVLLMMTNDGHAPGTRVRMTSGTAAGRVGTVVGALWGPSGRPVGYRVRDDVGGTEVAIVPSDLTVPAGQEAGGHRRTT